MCSVISSNRLPVSGLMFSSTLASRSRSACRIPPSGSRRPARVGWPNRRSMPQRESGQQCATLSLDRRASTAATAWYSARGRLCALLPVPAQRRRAGGDAAGVAQDGRVDDRRSPASRRQFLIPRPRPYWARCCLVRSMARASACGFGVRTHAGRTTWHGSVGDYWWGGDVGTYFWVDPQEELIAILIGFGRRGRPCLAPVRARAGLPGDCQLTSLPFSRRRSCSRASRKQRTKGETWRDSTSARRAPRA